VIESRRRSLLATALVLASLRPDVPERRILRAWLDTWQGIGHVTVGMDRQGYDLQLTKYAKRGWRASFYVSGIEQALYRAYALISVHSNTKGVEFNASVGSHLDQA
jgi:hypothetical protein